MDKEQSYSSVFADIDVHYWASKVEEAVRTIRPECDPMGVGALENLSKVVSKYKSMLNEKGLLQQSNLEEEIDLVEYAISELKSFLESRSGFMLEEKGPIIFSIFLKERMEDLKKSAKELDNQGY